MSATWSRPSQRPASFELHQERTAFCGRESATAGRIADTRPHSKSPSLSGRGWGRVRPESILDLSFRARPDPHLSSPCEGEGSICPRVALTTRCQGAEGAQSISDIREPKSCRREPRDRIDSAYRRTDKRVVRTTHFDWLADAKPCFPHAPGVYANKSHTGAPSATRSGRSKRSRISVSGRTPSA